MNPIKESIKSTLDKHGLKPLKKMGQNFLTDKNVLKKIILAADLKKTDTVLEIGPGLGALTTGLAEKTDKVIAIEKDEELCNALKKILDTRNVQNVKVINQDILNTKYEIPNTNYKLIANLPYYITSPTIKKFLEIDDKPDLIILTIQKEVAERIVNKTKMSVLSVSVQFYADAEIIDYVSKNSFYPVPKVDSAIIKIVPREKPAMDAKKFFSLVKVGFSSKRKKLVNNLSPWLKKEKGELQEILKKININPDVRAEKLSVKDWLNLFHNVDF